MKKALTQAAGDTLPQLLADNARRRGRRTACREKEYGIWQTWSWRQVEEETQYLALGLECFGLKQGDRLAIVGDNRPRLYWGMLAAQSLGAVPVPVYQDAVADEMAYVLGHAGARIVLAENQEQVDKVLAMREQLPDLERIVYVDPRGMRSYDHVHLHPVSEIQRRGRDAGERPRIALERRIADGSGDDVCIILYTSGTTGRPKGVVLTQRNIVVSSRMSVEFDRLGETEETLAYLPMAWVGDFIFSVGQSYVAGFCVSCPESQETMLQDLREIGPTYFFAPPRIFESMLTSVMVRMEDASAFKRALFRYFLKVASLHGWRIIDGQPVRWTDRTMYALGNLLVYAPLRNALGLSRVRCGYTAGEAVGPDVFRFYRSLGINLKQLYGQTEATVFVAGQSDGEAREDTAGPPCPGVDLRVDEAGEVQYRSAGVFREYFRNPDATVAARTEDGWVRSGDAGLIEEGTGHLRILDRIKDVGRLAGGAVFSPKYIENKLKFFPEIQEAVVVGDGRDEVCAMVNIDLKAVGSWAERNGVVYASYQELAGHPRVREILASHIAGVNRSLACDPALAPCQIRRFLVLHKELDADDGELTRTRKLRRRIIEERYGDLIAAFYDGSDSVRVRTEVTYEDGRKGMVEADLRIETCESDALGARAA